MASSTPHRVAWIGLGNLGLPIAQNLQTVLTQATTSTEVAASLPFAVEPALTVYNRTTGKAAPIQALGGQLAPSIAEVAETCQIIFTCLANDQAVGAVFRELISTLRARQEAGRAPTSPVYLVDVSTVSEALVTELNESIQLLTAAQPSSVPIYYLRCPVFGPPAAAQSAALVWVLSGPDAARAAIKGLVLPGLGRASIDMGTDIIKGSNMKLLGNYFITATIESLSEAGTLAEAAGLGTAKALEFIELMFPFGSYLGYCRKQVRPDERHLATSAGGTSAPAFPTSAPTATTTHPVNSLRLDSVAAQTATPVSTPGTETTAAASQDGFITDVGFTVDNGLKDVNLILDLARRNNVQLPTLDALRKNLTTLQASGLNHWDWSAAIVATRWAAQLPGYHNDTTFASKDRPAEER
ncbi:hypothetical protein IWQ60_010554 [Tieghemiomyces parasiticus]|uniref:6-phosphogluconate dehydrogenase NADP-binding domain-containing protein n=1 Tax=Tieghemiomyces parasiticus TaxID=78921 RepID=A0A9W7ZU75_9FUNG|nr:hypothetical protein IWQ60_010554 [Tieghemiomyces parasiticus]